MVGDKYFELNVPVLNGFGHRDVQWLSMWNCKCLLLTVTPGVLVVGEGAAFEREGNYVCLAAFLWR